MRTWEFVLQEKYEQDRMRLMDYREIDLEFKEWLIELFYGGVTEQDERSEHNPDDDSVRNDRICDRECVRTEQDQDADPGPDHADDEWNQVRIGDAEDRLAEMIAAEPAEGYTVTDGLDCGEEDIYENLYEEIAEYRSQKKTRPKKKKHKRK